MKKIYSIILLLSFVFVSCGKKSEEQLNQQLPKAPTLDILNVKKIQHTVGYFVLNSKGIDGTSTKHQFVSSPVINMDVDVKNTETKELKSLNFKIVNLGFNDYGKTVLTEEDRMKILDNARKEGTIVNGALVSGASAKINTSLAIWPSKDDLMNDSKYSELKNKIINYDYKGNYFDKKINKAQTGEIDNSAMYDLITASCLGSVTLNIEATYKDGTKGVIQKTMTLGNLVYKFLEINQLDLTKTGDAQYVDLGIVKVSQIDGENLLVSKPAGNYMLENTFTDENVYLMFTDKNVDKDRNVSSDRIIINEEGVALQLRKNMKNADFNPKLQRIDIREKLEKESSRTQITNVSLKRKSIVRNTELPWTKLDKQDTFKVQVTNNSKNSGKDINAEVKATMIARNKVGDRQVNIWVDDNYKDKISKVDAQILADKFLKDGKKDIYTWITNVFGKEWADKGQSLDELLIDGNGEIDILLTELNQTYDESQVAGGYVMGYFWSENTFKGRPLSNQKNIFFIDANKYTKPEERPSLESTLAHEFVHMINWFQKDLIKGAHTASWLNEMFAMIGEDLLDDKLEGDGSKDRAGLYNYFNYLDINDKDGEFDVYDYAPVALYGAYLTRTYVKNDLSFIRNMMHNSYGAEDAIEYALRKATISGEPETFLDTIKNFGKASVLSDNDSVLKGTKYWMNNRPEFQVNEGGVLYSFEPINLFDNKLVGKYSFRFFNVGDTNAPLLNGGANMFYDLGRGSKLTGNKKFNFNLPEGVDFEIIVKDASGVYNKKKSLEIQNLIKAKTN